MLDLFTSLIAAVFEARAQLDQPPQDGVMGPAAPPAITHAEQIEQLKQLCQQHRDACHQALRQIAREFINDWQAIVHVLDEPRLPLSRVEMWRGGRRFGLSVAAPFVWRCPSTLAVAPFPHPPRRTGRALLTHPALFRHLKPSRSSGRVWAAPGVSVPTLRRGTGQGIGGTPFPVCHRAFATRS